MHIAKIPHKLNLKKINFEFISHGATCRSISIFLDEMRYFIV
jgi:hypothetical protein